MQSILFRSAIISVCVMCFVTFVHADTVDDQRASLQQQLSQIQKDIEQNQQQLSTQQRQRTSLERDAAIMDSKIQAAQLGIKQRDLTLQSIRNDVARKAQGIQGLDSQVMKGQASLAQILRETQLIDDTPLVIQTLSSGTLSDLFKEQDSFDIIKKALGESFTQMANTRSDLAARKQALEDQQQEEQDLLQIQKLQQGGLKKIQQEKQNLVVAARGQEATYLQLINNKKQTAKQIEAALFSLRDTTKSVSFGDIYSYAREAGAKTGVRPAVILGILAEETNLGQNLGSGNWRTDMHPTRDVPVFQTICAQLGINPDSQPVSKKPWYGWGGAMGPAQFIPSTWVMYAERIAKMSGQSPANPWDPRTATFAAAILMMDNGADAQTPAAERLAALRYLAGWKNATKAAYAFYGDDVMENAAKFQSQISIIGG
jgi:membrane-bound lytic murein transglycosylase B